MPSPIDIELTREGGGLERPRPLAPQLLAPLLFSLVACGPNHGSGDGERDVADAEGQRPVDGLCPSAEASDPYIDCVDSFVPGDASFGHDLLPTVLFGPPRGAGALGGTDVVSLGCGGEITVYFAGEGIEDGPGDDFIVFENPFALSDGSTFVEPALVFVSDDGERWREFPCDLDAQPPIGCAGIGLVRAGAPDNPGDAIDPQEHEAAGGDAFDLAEVGLSHARWIRLVDVGELYYGHGLWCAGGAGGFDLDAIAAIHVDDVDDA